MIVIKIELHSARTHKISELGKMHICNDGITTKANPKRGTYNVTLFRKGTNKVLRTGSVEDWPRFNYSIWKLLGAAICSVYPNPKSKLNEILAGCKDLTDPEIELTDEDFAALASEEHD